MQNKTISLISLKVNVRIRKMFHDLTKADVIRNPKACTTFLCCELQRGWCKLYGNNLTRTGYYVRRVVKRMKYE